MNLKYLFGLVTIALVAACQTPSQKCSGTYNGQYTNNALILNGINTTVTSNGDNQVNVTLNAGGVPEVTVTGISITANGDNFALTKTELLGVFSGAVNGNELSVGYSSIGGAITFVGTK